MLGLSLEMFQTLASYSWLLGCLSFTFLLELQSCPCPSNQRGPSYLSQTCLVQTPSLDIMCYIYYSITPWDWLPTHLPIPTTVNRQNSQFDKLSWWPPVSEKFFVSACPPLPCASGLRKSGYTGEHGSGSVNSRQSISSRAQDLLPE